MEFVMYGDPKKKCCACENGADLKEGTRYFCCDHYATNILGKTMEQIEKELKGYELDI